MRRLLLLVVLSAVPLSAIPSAAWAATPTSSAQRAGAVARVPVSFTVRNVNRSRLACATDGRSYVIRGQLVGPRGALNANRGRAATLYLHGLAFGRFLFDSGLGGDADYANQQARRGHVSVVIDRLGYDSSGKPEGSGSCLGGQADVAHQIVGQLRSGRYRASRSPAFRRVVLAGHSVGGILAQLEAYSFRDVDGVIVISYLDQGATPATMQSLAESLAVCQAGGQHAEEPAGPGGYAYFGQTPAAFASSVFATAAPRVIDFAVARRNRNACGDLATVMAGTQTDLANVGSIRVPVLVVTGREDKLFAASAGPSQLGLLTGTRDKSLAVIPGAGHAISLDGSAPRFRTAVGRWLNRHGFSARGR